MTSKQIASKWVTCTISCAGCKPVGQLKKYAVHQHINYRYIIAKKHNAAVSHTKCFMPHLVENDWLDCCFKCGKCCSKFMRLTACIDKLQPASAVKSPVGMQQRSWNVAFQLKDAGSQRGKNEGLGAECCAVPRELTGRRQTELVWQMTAFVSFVSVLVLVQRQCISAVLVLVMLVVAFHTCTSTPYNCMQL